jgi:hypothetical protein
LVKVVARSVSILFAGIWLSACSTALDDAEVRRRIENAEVADGADAVAGGDLGDANDDAGSDASDTLLTEAGCGNKNTEPALGEQCDDGNTDECDGCHECKLHVALRVQKSEHFAMAGGNTNPKFQFDAPFGISAMFRLNETPEALGTQAFFGLSGKDAAGKGYVLALAVTRAQGDQVSATCVIGQVGDEKSMLLVDAGKIDKKKWYHLRCNFVATGVAGKQRELQASLDGGKYVSGKLPVTAVLPPRTDNAAMFGAIPVPLKGLPGLWKGDLDEVHVTTEPPADPVRAPKVANGTKGTVALYHMDAHAQRQFFDAGPTPATAAQVTPNVIDLARSRRMVHDLDFTPDDCHKPSAAP